MNTRFLLFALFLLLNSFIHAADAPPKPNIILIPVSYTHLTLPTIYSV